MIITNIKYIIFIKCNKQINKYVNNNKIVLNSNIYIFFTRNYVLYL